MQSDVAQFKYQSFTKTYFKLYAENGHSWYFRGLGSRCVNLVGSLCLYMQAEKIIENYLT